MPYPSLRHALLLLLLLPACQGPDKGADTPEHTGTPSDSGGTDSGGADSGGGAHLRLTGAVAKGPFIRGSSVGVAALDSAGTPTGALFATETDDDAGHFSLSLDLDGPVRIEAQGYYYNEVTGRLSTAPITLRSYHSIVTADEAVAFVNTFTHLSSPRVASLLASGAAIGDAITLAETEAVLQLHVGPATFDPGADGGSMDLLGGDDDANAYLFALSTVLAQHALNLAGEDGPVDATLSELLNGVASDLADGTLDGGDNVPTGAELYALQATIDADAVMALLAARFAAIGSDAAVPDLHRVFDLDLDGTADLYDTDADADGFTRIADGGDDCDDYDPSVHPGAAEDFLDGVDSDCSDDTDGDGARTPESGGDDCDDGDPTVFPGAEEIWYDGVDQDCDGASDDDQDGDGFDAAGAGGADCDDLDASTWPGADEIWYDGVDQDCGGDGDSDQDGDGFDAIGVGGTDCDDLDADTWPGAVEIWYDGLDQDCDGASDYDQDGDGYDDDAFGGLDCDDASADVRPGLAERCSTAWDDDCDSDMNDPGAEGCSIWYEDLDGDTFGSAVEVCICSAEGAYTADNAADCDDADGEVSPVASELWYDGVDQDCDGLSDYDQDVDGHDATLFGGDDCDDTAGSISPSAPERCATPFDDDCDGDDNDLGAEGCTDWSADLDGDGYGSSDLICACEATAEHPVGNQADCDDADDGVNPSADEACWSLEDTDCDGAAIPCISVSELGSASAIFKGEGRNDNASRSMFGGRDVNGDGLADMLVGSYNQLAASQAGASYLVLGRASPTTITLTAADAKYSGTTYEYASTVGMSDLDGDGYADVLVGATLHRESGSTYSSGALYIIYGSPAPSSISVSGADVQLTGETPGDGLGITVAGVGDVNGDGLEDLLVGHNVDPVYSGGVYLVLGSDSLSSGSIAAAEAELVGEALRDYAQIVAGGGDVDGDGLDDMLVGAPGSADGGSLAGTASLIFGSGAVPSGALSAMADVRYVGKVLQKVGQSVALGGDVDHDGYADLLIGAPNDVANGYLAGAAYLISGQSSGWESSNLAGATATFLGTGLYDCAGAAVSLGGDVNADGFDDLLIGRARNECSSSSDVPGYASLVIGSPELGSIVLSSADATFTGETNGNMAGSTVSITGDVDGNGYDDLLIGAYYNRGADMDAGAAYLLLSGL